MKGLASLVPRLSSIRSLVYGFGAGVVANVVGLIFGLGALAIGVGLHVFEVWPGRTVWKRAIAGLLAGAFGLGILMAGWWLFSPTALEKRIDLYERYPESWLSVQGIRYPQGQRQKLAGATLRPAYGEAIPGEQRLTPVVRSENKGVALRSVTVFLFIPRYIEVRNDCGPNTRDACWILNDVTSKHNVYSLALAEIPYGISAGAWGSLYLSLTNKGMIAMEYHIAGIALTPNGNAVGLDKISGKFSIDVP